MQPVIMAARYNLPGWTFSCLLPRKKVSLISPLYCKNFVGPVVLWNKTVQLLIEFRARDVDLRLGSHG
jgi:hypothetical protein